MEMKHIRLLKHDGTFYSPSYKGRLEVFNGGQWGTVCMKGFGDQEARVACKSLGLPGGVSVGNNMPGGWGKIWMSRLSCTGKEATLRECTFRGWGIHDCNHKDDVGISCGMPTTESVAHAVSGLRLVKHGRVL
jgi:hypothetical protein